MSTPPAPSIYDHIRDFEDAMRAAGLEHKGQIRADGELHRFNPIGDKSGKRSGWYIFHADDKPAGAFGTWKGGERTTWTAERTTPMSEAERRELREKAAAARKRKAEETAALQASAALRASAMWEEGVTAAEHPYLAKKGLGGDGLRIGVWIKEWVDKNTGEIRSKRFPNTLLIPMRNERRAIVGLQAIFAAPIEWAGSTRDKDFVYGQRKEGLFFPIGKPQTVGGRPVFLVGEGWATCRTVHDATGHAVLVAFDAGNVLHVARFARRLMPDAFIVMLADNDAWTKNNRGEPWNPGVEKATVAASTVGGGVVVPWFVDVSEKPTDFDDLRRLQGVEEVRRQVLSVVDPEAVRPAARAEPEEPPFHEEEPDGAPPGENLPDSLVSQEVDHDTEGYFDVRGFDRDNFYVYQHERKMIVCRSQSDWGPAALVTLAPLPWWEGEFPGGKSGFDAKAAHNWLARAASRAGYFNPESCRGRGAWKDDGRIVYHFGHRLFVDGDMRPLSNIKSAFIYEQGRRLREPSAVSLSKADGKRVLDMAEGFHWTRPASALLLAGWCALAPICGALRWRPHIWLTGGAGSGKSTVLELFVEFLMNGSRIYANGLSTEPGLRQELKTDALPLLFEESEQNSQHDRLRIQAVLALLRQGSSESGARQYKGSATGAGVNYMIRSMACLCSIQVGIEQQADMERITKLALRSKRDAGDQAAENWKVLSAALTGFRRDEDLPGRLMRRALELLPITMQNIDVFAAAAAKHFGSQRDGDQYGAMLAGAWSLIRDGVATDEQAAELIGRYDWTDYTIDAETEGSDKALGALLGSRVRIDRGGEATIFELVKSCGRPSDSDETIAVTEADKVLKRYGIKVEWTGSTRNPHNGWVLVANTSEELKRLMEKTPYAAGLKDQISRVPGAKVWPHPTRFHGLQSRAIALPLPYVLEGIEGLAPVEADNDIPF